MPSNSDFRPTFRDWLMAEHPAQVSKVLGLDEDHPPLMLVVVGKGAKPPWPRLGLLNLEDLVSVDRFGNHSMTGEVDA